MKKKTFDLNENIVYPKPGPIIAQSERKPTASDRHKSAGRNGQRNGRNLQYGALISR